MSKLPLKENWEEEDHRDFYAQLKKLPTEEQAKAVLSQASLLTHKAGDTNHDLLKAAESLVNFWMLRYSDKENRGQADYLLQNIYEKMQEHDKARKFSGRKK